MLDEMIRGRIREDTTGHLDKAFENPWKPCLLVSPGIGALS